MPCPTCGSPFHEACRLCPSCNTDLGFPNVRAASKPDEIEALRNRCRDADVSAKARNFEKVLDEFTESVKRSKAVINQQTNIASALLSNDNALYTTFYHSVEAQARMPESNEFDSARTAIDSTLFPNYHKDMRFAALSLDGSGLPTYGPLTIVLKEDIIKHRATVFEENSMEFCRRHRIVVGDPVPSGYRATWQNRHELARAKLHPQLTASTSAGDFPKILLKPADANNPDSFIEVHIYGSFNRRGVESVVATGLKKREDKVLLKSMKTRLKEIGATLTEV